MAEEKKSKSTRNWLAAALFGAAWIPLVEWVAPGTIPIPVFSLWDPKGGVADWLAAGVPVFAWGMFAQTAWEVRKARSHDATSLVERLMSRAVLRALGFELSLRRMVLGGLAISARAAVLEEICFRWLILLSAVPGILIANWLIFGWAGFGLAQWLHVNVWGPLADWTSFGVAGGVIFHPTGWALGAAALYSNAFFRDGHKYQGLFGWVNSWFLGLVFLHVAFAHGLLAAILVHFVYDAIVFTVASIGAWVRWHR